jgi:hypothetical protein
MIDCDELVAAIRRIREIDVKVVVWNRIVDGKCVLIDLERRTFRDPLPTPAAFGPRCNGSRGG